MKWQTGLPKTATGVLEKLNPLRHTWSSAAVLPPNPSRGSSGSFHSVDTEQNLSSWLKNTGCELKKNPYAQKPEADKMTLLLAWKRPHGKDQSRLWRNLKCNTRGLGSVKSIDCQYEICACDKASTLATLSDSSSLLRLYFSSTR